MISDATVLLCEKILIYLNMQSSKVLAVARARTGRLSSLRLVDDPLAEIQAEHDCCSYAVKHQASVLALSDKQRGSWRWTAVRRTYVYNHST